MLTCGNSDPGTSGILSPFSKIKGLYFNNDGEPDFFLTEFVKDINRLIKKEGHECIEIEFETKEEYYEIMNYVEHFLDNDIVAYGVFRDKPAVIFQREPDMIAEHETGEVTTDYEDTEDDE